VTELSATPWCGRPGDDAGATPDGHGTATCYLGPATTVGFPETAQFGAPATGDPSMTDSSRGYTPVPTRPTIAPAPSPQAIGAQFSHPGRQVVTLSGDDGVSMLLGDLLSLRQLNLPVKMVVFNNGSLNFVELEMKATGFLSHATELVNPDFAKIADGTEILGLHVEDPEQVRPAMQQAFAHDGPALVDIAANRQELAMPPSLKLDQIVDSNLYMVKAILNGRGDEIVELARTNLFR